MTTVSAVIATRNRHVELRTLLRSLAGQSRLVSDTIVVDASDTALGSQDLASEFPTLHVQYLTAAPSVCAQRNTGIRLSKSEYVFICDDDMVLPTDYVQVLMTVVETHPLHEAVSGVIIEESMPAQNLVRLFWNWCFMLSIWTDIRSRRSRGPYKVLEEFLIGWYSRRGNDETAAGWPLVSMMDEPFFKTRFYGLGASILSRQWLLKHPYDEILDQFGIGDHYGLARGFPERRSITVLTNLHAIHHRSPTERLPRHASYYRRVLALDYFRSGDWKSRLALLWSLLGNCLAFTLRMNGPMTLSTLLAAWKIIVDKNPYREARRRGDRGPINPELPF